MSKYHWLLTVKLTTGELAIVAMRDSAPGPGDLVELEDGALATVVTKEIFTDYGIAYQAATAIEPPRKVVCWYERNEIEEDSSDVPA